MPLTPPVKSSARKYLYYIKKKKKLKCGMFPSEAIVMINKLTIDRNGKNFISMLTISLIKLSMIFFFIYQ